MTEAYNNILRSKTEERIAHFAMWTSLFVYLGVWFISPIVVAGPEFWYVGILAGIVYVSMHIYEIRWRHHCYLSADSTAVPVTITFVGLLYLMMWLTGKAKEGAVASVFSLAGAFMIGHVASLFYSMVISVIAERIYRQRIKDEKY